MPSVVVRGTAAASVTPDRAQLTLDISHVATDAATALEAVADRSRELQAVLDAHGVAAGDRATAGLQVGEEFEWRDNQQVRVGYRAGTSVTVTVRAIAAVAPLIGAAVTEAGAAVRQLTWHVDRDNPIRTQLLGDAARDARVRAAAYATALGLRLGEVELISEVAPTSDPIAPRGVMMAMDAAPRAKAAEVAVSEGLVELETDVHVRFSLIA